MDYFLFNFSGVQFHYTMSQEYSQAKDTTKQLSYVKRYVENTC